MSRAASPRSSTAWACRRCSAMVLGVLLAGLAGLLFSPIAARLRGIYLGVASLGLVFIGQHVLNTLDLGDRRLQRPRRPRSSRCSASTSPQTEPSLVVLGVPFGRPSGSGTSAWSWPLAAMWFARNLLRSRPGPGAADPARQRGRRRGDGRQRAALQGPRLPGLLDVRRAGGRALRAVHRRVAPESFALVLSVQYLAMIVLGGLGSVGGAAAGAAFVSALPLVFQQYAGVAALRRRARFTGDRRQPGRALPLRPRHRPRRPVRARRPRRPRRTPPRKAPRRSLRNGPPGLFVSLPAHHPGGVQPMKTSSSTGP